MPLKINCYKEINTRHEPAFCSSRAFLFRFLILRKGINWFSLNVMKHPSKDQHYQFLLNFSNLSELNALRNYQKEINAIWVTQELQIMADIYGALLKTYRPRDDLRGWWACLVWCRKLPAIGRTAELLLIGVTDWKHQALRVACSEWDSWTNAFGMGSCNSWLTMKYCACVPTAFLARIISCSVDSTFFYTLGSTQPLAEMSTRNIFWGGGFTAAGA
jgi:hypothetical protein